MAGRLNPSFTFGVAKAPRMLKPHSPAESIRIDPLVPYDPLKSQTLTFHYTVPSGCFFRFSTPSVYMQSAIQVATTDAASGTSTYESLLEADRMMLLAPFAVIRGFKVNLNTVSLSLSYPNDLALARLLSLSLRTTTPEYQGSLEFARDQFFLPSYAADRAKTATEESYELKNLLNITAKEGQPLVLHPIWIPLFPFSSLPLHDQICEDMPKIDMTRVFGEHCQITITMNLRPQADLADFVEQFKVKTAADAAKTIRTKITDFFLMGELWAQPQDSGILTSYRQYIRKQPLLYPLLLPAESESHLMAGKDTSTIHFSVQSFEARFALIYFKTEDDDASTRDRPKNVTYFRFPAALRELHITCGEDSIVGPVENINSPTPHHSKLHFHKTQLKYHRVKTGLTSFFSRDCLDQFVIVDFFPVHDKYKTRLGITVPDMVIKMTWSETKCPDKTSIVIQSFKESRIEADVSSPTNGQVFLH